ncbi:MAG: Acyl-CoA dehydrogenase [Deltaproteobacteria bacterium ADurb.BinA179]|jgi:alkylation response protein AidB-like acyl-CoA dehydrogenase|nr:MAG: Acyl-CoA dehydrogenase [Deltaproteobacteria bacterium ADurb.BinA179]HNU73651.1 acyl-CoA dehydrogenase family protein [Deltaproteobacteria bacterium]HRT44593.1 acyl-CoA dehydrogenase family protein [Desulfomonilia bacterium]HOD69454.1 acyl-CoA dehydrogenase family protein [Deltaproteobacteria bacterium]HOE71313.1 acyl-CoA dehydrogenase family protein [Deltaproteobacteria bacterium]
MDYELSPEQAKMQRDIDAFCRSEIAPRAGILDACPRSEVGRRMKENLKTLARAGWFEPGHKENSLDLVEVYLAGEAVAKACPSTCLSARASAFLCAGGIRTFGTDAQKSAYLPPLLRAEQIGAFAWSEPQAGSDVQAIASTARKDGASWRISGRKDIVVNAPIADVILVLAYHDAQAGAEGDMSIFIVEKGAAGLTISDPLETMGMRGAPISTVTLQNCEASGILGDIPGEGYVQHRSMLNMGCIGVAALCVGVGTACMEISNAYAKERTAFGKRIGMYQEVGFKLADMFTYNDLGRMLALKAAWAINTNDPEAPVLAACAKLFASEAATRIAGWGMQIFAGHGYLAGSHMERLYRDARFGEICEGTSEMQRSLIARTELDRFLQAGQADSGSAFVA